MQNHIVSIVKSVALVNILQLIVCHAAFADCLVGVNSSECRPKLVEKSVWSMHTSAHLENDDKNKVPGSDHDITIFYEFAPKHGTHRAQWRRSILVESGEGKVAMFQAGHFAGGDDQEIKFVIDDSSCPEEIHRKKNDTFSIFYKRKNDVLSINSVPIKDDQDEAPKSTSDTLLKLAGHALGSYIQASFESNFSYGGAKAMMTANHGELHLDTVSVNQVFAEKKVVFGCFNTFGGFAKPMTATNQKK